MNRRFGSLEEQDYSLLLLSYKYRLEKYEIEETREDQQRPKGDMVMRLSACNRADPPPAISRTLHPVTLQMNGREVPRTSIDGLLILFPSGIFFFVGGATERRGVAAAIDFGMGSDFRVRFAYIYVWHTDSAGEFGRWAAASDSYCGRTEA